MDLAPEEQGTALTAFARALRRESNVLGRRPEITWQQLANRLQWEAEPVESLLEAERDGRSAAGADPWLWLRTPAREARALRQVLDGHTGWVCGCAFSPDGALLASASDDWTLRLWDARTGAPGPVLEGHTGRVSACAFSPDGALLASASWDGTLRLRHGQSFVAPAAEDGSFRIWDAPLSEVALGVRIFASYRHQDSLFAGRVYDRMANHFGRDNVVWDIESIEPGKAWDEVLDVFVVVIGPDWLTVIDEEALHGRRVLMLALRRELLVIPVLVDGAHMPVPDQLPRGLLALSKIQAQRIGHGSFDHDVGQLIEGIEKAVTVKAARRRARTKDNVWDGPILEFPAPLLCVALAPDRPLAACGDVTGSLHRVELVGVNYGPLLVTAVYHDGGPKVRCPCGAEHPLDVSWLGSVVPCPTCGRELRVNEFVVEPLAPSIFCRKRRRPFWRR